MDTRTRVRILSCNKLFPPDCQPLIEDAVNRSTLTFEICLQFAKLHFLDIVNNTIAQSDAFNRSSATQMTTLMDLSEEFFSNALTVVSNAKVLGEERNGKHIQKKGRPFSQAKQQLI